MRLLKVWIYEKPFGFNRRDSARIKSRNLIRCLRSDDTPQESLCNLLDLSENGLKFVSSKQIKPGAILKLVLNLAEKETNISVAGKVVWSSKISHVHAYRVGISFLSMSEEHKALIHRFVRRRSSR